jgi:glycyl-tRNA synthetase beta chain
MVLTDDEQLRNNRLALLSNLHRMLNQVADISKLAA